MTKAGKVGVDKFVVKILGGIWVGILVYAGLSITLGSKGLLPYNKLLQERDRLAANFERIRKTNDDLNIRNILLGSKENDPDAPIPADFHTTLSLARDMGYGLPGDIMLNYNGIELPQKTFEDAGTPQYAFRMNGIPDYVIKIIGLMCGLCAIICLTLPDVLVFCRDVQEEGMAKHYRAPLE
jgi:hypothetical protein